MSGMIFGRWNGTAWRFAIGIGGFLLALSVPLILVGCDDRSGLDRLASTSEAKLGQQFAEDLRHGDIDALVKYTDPKRPYGDPHPGLLAASHQFPAETPQIELAGYTLKIENGIRYCDLVYQYTYPAHWLVVEVMLQLQQPIPVLAGLHVYPQVESLEEQARIDFGRMPAVAIAAFILGMLNLVFSIVTLLCTWRIPVPRWRWLWRFAILCGAGSWTVNLHSGAWAWVTLMIGIPVTTGAVGTLTPPLIVLHLPVFALAYWLRQSKRRAREFALPDDIASTF